LRPARSGNFFARAQPESNDVSSHLGARDVLAATTAKSEPCITIRSAIEVNGTLQSNIAINLNLMFYS
jgi:hypothetical protein